MALAAPTTAAAAFVLLGVACSSAPAPVETKDEGAGMRRCGDVRGYLNHLGDGGGVIHARGDGTSPVLGRLPAPVSADGREWAMSFDIKASQGGWLLIEGASDDPALTGGIDRTMYRGQGWIRGAGVSAGVQSARGFAAPSTSAAVTLQTGDGGNLDAQGEIVGIVACEGDWVLARWKVHQPSAVRLSGASVISQTPLIVQAWSTGICNIQETSCDMDSGDPPASDKTDLPK